MTLQEKHQANIFTVTVELDPPKSSSAEKTFAEASQLYGIADAINIADCPMAKMRMSPIALAHVIQSHKGMEAIFHLTCRDRNTMGLQSELLGASALGVHNILTLTGDHPSQGDHPQTTPVFEVDSMGLLKIASSLNKGFDLNGNPLEEPTNFYIGTTGNPGTDDLEKEISRLQEKIDCGAHFIQTQPIYDLEKASAFIKAVKPLGVPVLLGLIPLKSFKMASYLHDKVPGISLTEEILERMKEGGKEEGLRIASEHLKEIRKIADGVHIMPLNDIATVLYLLEQ